MSTAALASLALLSACGGEEKNPLEGVAPPPAPTAASTPTPSLGAAPAGAAKKTDDGAKAFAEYYFETVVNEARTQGKLEQLVLASDVNCQVCVGTVGEIAYNTIARLRAEGGQVTVSGVKIETSTPELTTVELNYGQEKVTYKNPDGSTAYSVPSRTGVAYFVQLEWDASVSIWRVRQILDKKLVGTKATPSPS